MPKKPDQLEQVWQILTNPRRSIVSVAALAAEHGFDDLAAFNKDGSSPVAIRKAVRKRKVRFGAPKR